MLSRTITGTLCRVFALLIILAAIVSTGCTQPEKNPVTVTANPGAYATTATGSGNVTEPASLPSTSPAALPVASPATALPMLQKTTAVPGTPLPVSGGYTRFTGPEYSVEYPAAWSANSTRLRLYEYRHDIHGCEAAPAYNLDREVRTYASPDGGMLFYSSIVSTDRDIWPRNFQGNIVYEDVVNSVIGTLDTCANSPEGAFTIAGISQVPLDGVSYTGTRADYAKINATGFAEGTGAAYVVTGTQHRGVFLFYRATQDAGTQPQLGEYIFDSLRLDPGF